MAFPERQHNEHEYRLYATLGGDFSTSLTAIAVYPEGKFLAASSKDGRIGIYGLNGSVKLRTSFSVGDTVPTALAWGLGTELVVGLNDGRLMLFPRATKTYGWLVDLLKRVGSSKQDSDSLEIADLGASINTLTFQKETKRLFAAHGSEVSVLRRKNTNSWPTSRTINPPALDLTPIQVDLQAPYPVKVHLSRWEDQIIVCYRDHGIRAYSISDAKDTEVVWQILPEKRICASGLSPNSHHIAAWNLDTGLDLYTTMRSSHQVVDTIRLTDNFGIDTNCMLDVEFVSEREIVVGSNVGTPFIINFSQGLQNRILDVAERIFLWNDLPPAHLGPPSLG
ncbi:hypothetical protein V5O48_016303 [Marasmius crinis-equi]|uniref:Uncharacterized protein n=1 Tax=Marasmius crinis-equi TaxID=585013 RepID=A0ABR3ES36_9AGAR